MTEPIINDKLFSRKKKLSIIAEDIESSTGCLKLKLKKIKRTLIMNPKKNIPITTPFIEKFA